MKPTAAEIWQSHPRWTRVVVYISFSLLAAVVLLIALLPEPTQEPAPVEAKPAEMTPEQRVRQQFSAWSGAHMATERAIKAALNDPGSYKHFETRYWLRPDGSLKVVTEIGARNGFGGMVRLAFESIVTPTGEVVSITQLN